MQERYSYKTEDIFSLSDDVVLVTGAAGQLGSSTVNGLIDSNAKVIATDTNLESLKKVFPKAFFPGRSDFDVTNIDLMEKYIRQGPQSSIFPKDEAPTLIHAAAFTSPPKVEKTRRGS